MSTTNNPMGLKPGYLNWWQSLILALSCTLAGVLAAVAATTGGVSAPGGELGSWVTDLLKLIPHALMLFGLMADAITYDGVYWTSTIVGLSAMPVHGVLESMLGTLLETFTKMSDGLTGKKSTSVQTAGRIQGGGEFTGCSIMGGQLAKEHRTAQSLVVTASIIAYFFLDLWLNRGMINALGVLVLGIILMGGQAMAISDCFGDKSLTAAVLYGMLFGVVVGGGYYAFFQSFYPMYLPSTVIPLSNTISGATTESGFVYVPGIGLVSSTSPAGQQAIAAGKAMSPDEMSKALETTGTLGTGAPGQASTCS